MAARIAGLVAHQALARAVDAPAEQPPPLFAYDPGSRRLAVTTPNYSAAVVDQTIRLGYGGVDLARLYDGRGRPLGSTGSHDRTGFGVAITRRNGRRLLETQGGHRAAARFSSGKPLRGAFTTRTMTATVHGRRRTSVKVRRTFLADRIVTTYVLRGPRTAIAHIRFPVWDRLTRAPRPKVTGARGGGAVRARPPARRRLPRDRAHPQPPQHALARRSATRRARRRAPAACSSCACVSPTAAPSVTVTIVPGTR